MGNFFHFKPEPKEPICEELLKQKKLCLSHEKKF